MYVDIIPCSAEGILHLGERIPLSLKSKSRRSEILAASCLLHDDFPHSLLSGLKAEAIYSSVTSVGFRLTKR
jgi:hypothetical protein